MSETLAAKINVPQGEQDWDEIVATLDDAATHAGAIRETDWALDRVTVEDGVDFAYYTCQASRVAT